jgi:DNA-binding SARP family transcriptional activator/DNA-binding NarL/FixJ family response regulator
MEFRVLGPIEVIEGGTPLDIGGAQARALLAALLLAHGNAVSTDRLVEDVGGDAAPAQALANLRVQVSRLRKVLGAGRIVTRTRGYALKLEPGELDADAFARLVRDGQAALADANADAAAKLLAEALAWWRGPAYAEVADLPLVAPEIARLEELQLAAQEDRLAAELGAGRHASVTGELERLTGEQPLRERLWSLRMLALYRSGRQTEALRAYQELREQMADQLGIEPGPEVRRLEKAILAQDPDLEFAAPSSPSPVKVKATATATASAALRVMLVDDHPMWRDATRIALGRAGVATIVGQAENGNEAVGVAVEVAPDVVLMDLSIPPTSGAEITHRLRGQLPGVRVLMLSASEDEGDVLDAVKAGAQGYLLKTSSAEELADAVRRVARGETVFSPALADVVLQGMRGDRSPAKRTHQGDGTRTGRWLCTLMFADMVDSTGWAARLGDTEWLVRLAQFHERIDAEVRAHRGRTVKTSGDGVLATFEQPGDGVRAAAAVRQTVNDLGLGVRTGVHMGECEVTADDVQGIAVHIAARVADRAGADEVLVSSTVRDLLMGSAVEFADRGQHSLKGVPGRWRLFALAGGAP